jgi:hypothetical protein
VTSDRHVELETIFDPPRFIFMVRTSHKGVSHIQRVLMLTMLITYFAPILGSVEIGVQALTHILAPSQTGVTIAYEEFNDSSNVVNLD